MEIIDAGMVTRRISFMPIPCPPSKPSDSTATVAADTGEPVIPNDAAMVAAFTDQSITEELLETSVKNTHPSLRADTLQIYDEIKRKMENTERRNMGRPKIGFT